MRPDDRAVSNPNFSEVARIRKISEYAEIQQGRAIEDTTFPVVEDQIQRVAIQRPDPDDPPHHESLWIPASAGMTVLKICSPG